MYNILIVDDEYLARNKLLFLLDWNQYNFHIIGEASTAGEAIEFLKTNQVQVVFSDVYMPDMDGIKLAEYIHMNYPEISVVIFSNYSDFNYVKGAFSANVIDYILKNNLNEETILNTLQTILHKKQNVSVHSDILPLIERERKYREYIKQALLSGSSEFHPENVMIAVMGISNYRLSMQLYTEQEQDMLYQNFENTIARIITGIDSFVVFNDGCNIILYLPFSQENSQLKIMNTVSEYIRQINSAIYKFFNFDLLWGVSVLSSAEYTVHQCYDEALSMLINQPSRGQKTPFDTQESATIRLSISMEKSLLSAISDLNMTKVNQCLEQIFEPITPADKMEWLINDLTSIAAKFCNEFGISMTETLSLPAASHIPQIYLSWSKELFKHIIDTRLSKKTLRYQSNYAHAAMEYIAQNYNNADISLGDIAKYVGISEQHLSKVFKNETGKTISAYLAEYRIERAKELLQKHDTNLKYVYSKIGFSDNSYFCTVFKKYAGCSPKEYKKKHLKAK